MPEHPIKYIGDGVYAIFDGYGVQLNANDHLNPTDTVYLEPEVLEALNKFYQYERNHAIQMSKMKGEKE